MSAIRLARGFTGRDKIVKFEGCYHGHGDSLLVKAGSGALTLGIPTSPGVPAELAAHTITLQFNDLDQIQQVFAEVGDQVAAVIVEPVAGNMNCVPPEEGFLQGLRDVCDASGAVLIFDEVMTGFRVALGGAQELYQITPDITTLGKIVGGGMPVGAIGGSKEIMEHLAPIGPVYQAGTLSGNPVGMAAGLATLNRLNTDSHQRLTQLSKALTAGLKAAADEHEIPLQVTHAGGMFGFVFTQQENPQQYSDIQSANQEHFRFFFNHMLNAGHYFAPSAFEAGFVSLAHTDDLIDQTIAEAKTVFHELSCSITTVDA